MIKASDFYNAMPELFALYSGELEKVPGAESDLDILFTYDREFEASDKFTIIVCTEPSEKTVHMDCADLIKRRPNSLWLITSENPNVRWQLDRMLFFPSNLVMTYRLNDRSRSWQLIPKNYLASGLLGGWGAERAFLFHQLKKKNLLDICLINFRRRPAQPLAPAYADLLEEYQSPEIPLLDDPRFQDIAYRQGGINTMVPVGPGLQQNYVSQIIPWQIYDCCWINLVAETSTETFLPSEKIAKPLMAGQPWMVLGCQYFLQKMRDLGFKTFHPWINESYDLEPDYQSRILLMVEALEEFNALPSDAKLSRIHTMSPMLEHNRRLMLDNKNWHDPLMEIVRSTVGDKVLFGK